MARVLEGSVAPVPDSALALESHRLEAGDRLDLLDSVRDSLLYVTAGRGAVELGERHEIAEGAAVLVLAGEEAVVAAGESGLHLVRATAGPDADRHAPLGPRQTVLAADVAEAAAATGSRSFRVLLGPHNGSTRATLFLGYVPPGRAPWHYHVYDEIVWVPHGPGRLHLGDAVEELGPGSAFRLRPREVHIVENASPSEDLTIVGVFTPAGSPAAAFLTPDVADGYRFSG